MFDIPSPPRLFNVNNDKDTTDTVNNDNNNNDTDTTDNKNNNNNNNTTKNNNNTTHSNNSHPIHATLPSQKLTVIDEINGSNKDIDGHFNLCSYS